MLKSAFDKVLGNNPELLLDKLGERLAYERTGVRLYEAMIAKALACEGSGAELVPTLQQIRNDEQAHMILLINAIETLGADPTAMTPCADVVGAIVAFTRSLAMNLSERGIRVNGVAPGPIWTPLIPSTFTAEEVSEFGGSTPMGRPGQPAELAPAYVYLASQDSSYVSGQVLHVNGGTVVNG